MGEFKNKNLFFILSGVFLALDPTQFQWEWAGEQGDPDKDRSLWGITELSQKTLGEVQVGDWKEA